MELAAAVTAVDAATRVLGQTPIEGVSADEFRDLLKRLKVASSRLEAQVGRLTFAADCVGSFIGTGARDTAEWLGKETGTSTRKNRNAADLGQAMAGSDELNEAMTNGDLSADKAAIIVGAAGGKPVDNELLDEVTDLPLNAVRPAVENWRTRNDPEGDAERAAGQRSRRSLTLTGQPDGMTRIEGLLDPEAGTIVRTALDAIMSESAFDNTGRPRHQRCADALTQLCAASSKGQIKGGRSNNRLLATVPFDTITERASARGLTTVGSSLDADTIRKLACDAGIHRVITGPGSSILDFGHETRLVPDNLFLALVARDQRCRWPGCTIRATWCDAHHITHWTDDGLTNDDNCVLLCHHHHQLSHQPGWVVTGTATELRIQRPDGAVEISRPPAASTSGPSPTGSPPTASPLRAGPAGRETPTDHVPTRQLTLV